MKDMAEILSGCDGCKKERKRGRMIMKNARYCKRFSLKCDMIRPTVVKNERMDAGGKAKTGRDHAIEWLRCRRTGWPDAVTVTKMPAGAAKNRFCVIRKASCHKLFDLLLSGCPPML
jgi:hypothetical protein